MFDAADIRGDFPILDCEVNGKPLVYLDSGATAQKPQQVIRCIENLYKRHNANIHRGVHRLSEEATERYEAARDRVQRFIGAPAREEIIFTALLTVNPLSELSNNPCISIVSPFLTLSLNVLFVTYSL